MSNLDKSEGARVRRHVERAMAMFFGGPKASLSGPWVGEVPHEREHESQEWPPPPLPWRSHPETLILILAMHSKAEPCALRSQVHECLSRMSL